MAEDQRRTKRTEIANKVDLMWFPRIVGCDLLKAIAEGVPVMFERRK
jgi:hypothetical protein